VIAGTQSNGQGHETAYAQVVAAQLGVDINRVKVSFGDSDRLARGGGTGGSRSLTMAGGASLVAIKDVIARGRAIAASTLGVAADRISYEDGQFRVDGAAQAIDLFEVARIAKTQANEAGVEGLAANGEYKNPNNTWPNGCHVCEVEIDPETGVTEIVRYFMVGDFGTVVNPLIVRGQVIGGVVQGIGQCLMEHTVYDTEGQLASGSFMDYAMPRADDAPMFHQEFLSFPATTNPLGVKGCGEAGCAGSLTSIMNAICDALAPYGVKHIDMPATPLAVWEAMQQGKGAKAA
jgi:carbon-monoxide dehydrogenase large subunit